MPADVDVSLTADVLVIGAGPAGSAAAMTLARAGADVVLIDRSSFPRDKVCGDGLIPDALNALVTLGLRERIASRARMLAGISVFSPGGREVLVRGECACLPRGVFDNVLRQEAVAAGARFCAPCRVVAPLERCGRIAGATLRSGDGRLISVHAPWTVLATGAAAEVLRAFGVVVRLEPSAIAGRMYLETTPELAAEYQHLVISFDRRIAPGYGWVFPGPDNVFNVGVGVFRQPGPQRAAWNLRTVMDRFLQSFAPARRIVEAAVSRTRFVGAPLRTALAGARFSRPGMLVAGEAAGATYSLSGEGIGKALETGIVAAEELLAAFSGSLPAAETADRYARRLEAQFRRQFRGYAVAERYLSYPAIADFLAWRANAGRFARSELEALFNETRPPDVLFSMTGLLKALVS
jgi:geranylgeranyl reductase family protein